MYVVTYEQNRRHNLSKQVMIRTIDGTYFKSYSVLDFESKRDLDEFITVNRNVAKYICENELEGLDELYKNFFELGLRYAQQLESKNERSVKKITGKRYEDAKNALISALFVSLKDKFTRIRKQSLDSILSNENISDIDADEVVSLRQLEAKITPNNYCEDESQYPHYVTSIFQKIDFVSNQISRIRDKDYTSLPASVRGEMIKLQLLGLPNFDLESCVNSYELDIITTCESLESEHARLYLRFLAEEIEENPEIFHHVIRDSLNSLEGTFEDEDKGKYIQSLLRFRKHENRNRHWMDIAVALTLATEKRKNLSSEKVSEITKKAFQVLSTQGFNEAMDFLREYTRF